MAETEGLRERCFELGLALCGHGTGECGRKIFALVQSEVALAESAARKDQDVKWLKMLWLKMLQSETSEIGFKAAFAELLEAYVAERTAKEQK